ncbi:MAG: glycosyltransferase family A protein [Acetobacteraceae bacterium]
MRIGIIIPGHDAAPWIADAIGSVIAQSYTDWSLSIVDDGSTDTTATIARRFLSDGRVMLIRQGRSGVSAARNRGIATRADADALLFLDADDWLAPDALARFAFALRAASAAVAVCGPARFVAEHARPGARAGRVLRCQRGDLLSRLLVRNLFANGGHVLVRAEAVREVGGFRSDLAYGEDWEFFTRIATQGKFARVRGRDPVLFVRRRPNGVYQRKATDPASFAPCMEAIFASKALLARFGASRLAAIRTRTEAENAWVIGRALLAHGRPEGRAWLRRSLAAKPSLGRLVATAVERAVRVQTDMRRKGS